MPPVRVFAPATVSNVGPGFDVLGFALHRPGDTVTVERCDAPGVELVDVSGDGGHLPRSATANSAGVAAAAVLARATCTGATGGLRLWLEKGLPLASGLGSSGASSAAAAVAANIVLGLRLSPVEVVACAMEGEHAASGAAHADNVAPSVMGGFMLIRSYDPLDLVRLPVPDGLFVAVVHPHCEVSTAAARALLRERHFALADIVANAGNLAALVAALHQQDLALLGRSIVDRLVEPVRAALIPGYGDVKHAALASGALGCSVSGSGPTVFAFADSIDRAARVAQAMRQAFRGAGVGTDAWTGPISVEGARVVASR
jgi:homoserine kinase